MVHDRHTAVDGMVATVPEAAGTYVAFIRAPDGDDRIVILHKDRACAAGCAGAGRVGEQRTDRLQDWWQQRRRLR